MKIHRLKLWNYKKFIDASFQFHPNFTVLIGENATGKTSILDAISILLGCYLFRSGIDIGRSGIRKNEARMLIHEAEGQVFIEPQLDVYVGAIGSLREESFVWSRRINDHGTEAKNLISIGSTDRTMISKGENIDLPLPLYYGSGRLWNIRRPVEIGKPESRTSGYQSCLDPRSNQYIFEKWFKQLELSVLQKRRDIAALDAVRNAVITCIPDAEYFYYDIASDQLMVRLTESGYCLFNNLSDGYRNMVAMVADIAHRASRINPHYGALAAQLTSGVVLIDEIDLHLHPKWQRRVVDDLQKAFPQMQFIVTTHSPFIIQSLSPGEVIDLNQPNNTEIITPDNVAAPGPGSPFSNRSIEDIVEDVMGVYEPQRSHRYQLMFEAAKEYYQVLKEAKEGDAAKKDGLKRKLDELSAPFSDNVAYHAFLEMERMAAGLGCADKQGTE